MPLLPFGSAPQIHPVPISQGGTGSATQNFVDLSSSTQTKSGSLILGGSLGTSSTYVPNVYATTINLNSTASLSGGTAGQIQVISSTNVTTLYVNNTATGGGYRSAIGAFITGLNTGGHAQFKVGQNDSDNNCAEFDFNYVGSGSASNSFSFGVNGNPTIISYDTAGNITLGGNSSTLVTISDSKNISLGTTTGTKIGTATNQKVAFFNSTPIVQPSAVGTATGYTAGTTAATFHSDDTYTGNTGTTAYTLNGIVAALKNLGLIAH